MNYLDAVQERCSVRPQPSASLAGDGFHNHDNVAAEQQKQHFTRHPSAD